VPPNCKFYVDDFESEWTFGPDEAFDFIHGRSLGGTIANYALLYQRILSNLNPGGWVEMQEFEADYFSPDDPSLSKAPNCKRWAQLGNQASEILGRVFAVAGEQKQKMIDAGFEDVREKICKVPIGTWAKDPKLKMMGAYQREQVILSLESYVPGLLGRVLGWSTEECQILIAEATRELRDPKIHLYTAFRFIYGRKPKPQTL